MSTATALQRLATEEACGRGHDLAKHGRRDAKSGRIICRECQRLRLEERGMSAGSFNMPTEILVGLDIEADRLGNQPEQGALADRPPLAARPMGGQTMNESMSREELDEIRAEAEHRQERRSQGLIGKFHVERVDGKSAPGEKHDGCYYFVLDVTHDPYTPPALAAYAMACRDEYPALADDLDDLPEVGDVGEQLRKIPIGVTDPMGNRFHLHGAKIAQPDYSGRCLLCP